MLGSSFRRAPCHRLTAPSRASSLRSRASGGRLRRRSDPPRADGLLAALVAHGDPGPRTRLLRGRGGPLPRAHPQSAGGVFDRLATRAPPRGWRRRRLRLRACSGEVNSPAQRRDPLPCVLCPARPVTSGFARSRRSVFARAWDDFGHFDPAVGFRSAGARLARARSFCPLGLRPRFASSHKDLARASPRSGGPVSGAALGCAPASWSASHGNEGRAARLAQWATPAASRFAQAFAWPSLHARL